jgi:hypothetical protein
LLSLITWHYVSRHRLRDLQNCQSRVECFLRCWQSFIWLRNSLPLLPHSQESSIAMYPEPDILFL